MRRYKVQKYLRRRAVVKYFYEGKFQKSYEELSRVENYCDTIKRPIEESFEKVMKSVKKLEKS